MTKYKVNLSKYGVIKEGDKVIPNTAAMKLNREFYPEEMFAPKFRVAGTVYYRSSSGILNVEFPCEKSWCYISEDVIKVLNPNEKDVPYEEI